MTNKELFEAAAGLLREYAQETEEADRGGLGEWIATEFSVTQARELAQWFQAESHATTYNPASLRLARSLVEDE